MFTKNPEFKPDSYYWYRENGRYSVHLVRKQTIQTIAGPQTVFVASNGNYLVSAVSMNGEWWDTPIPLPVEEEASTAEPEPELESVPPQPQETPAEL